MLETGNIIWCDRADPRLPKMEFDMALCRDAEQNIGRIATVTPVSAPYLLALFNEAYLVVGRYYAQLDEEVDRAHNAARRRRAVIILDECPDIVKEKGLGNARSPLGSEDIRNAVVDKDESYNDILDKTSALKATKTLMWMKLQAIEMAYNSVKKILSDVFVPGNLGTASIGDLKTENAQDSWSDKEPEEVVGKVSNSGWGVPKY